MNLLPYILKELLNHKGFSILFIMNLSLGLTGFIALDGFKNAIDKTLQEKSKSILGADLGLSSRSPLSSEDLSLVSDAYRDLFLTAPKDTVHTTHIIEIFSMVANSRGNSRLVQIKAIESNFPFYGQIELKENRFARAKELQGIYSKPVAWVYPEILTQLQININDTIRIGEIEFQVVDVVLNDSASGFTTNMAPRIYIGLPQIEKTNLVKTGSIAWYSTLFKLPFRKEQLNEVKKTVFSQIDDPDVRVYTHEDASVRVGRLLSNLNSFLGLASLIALFLASIGTGFLFRSYLKNKIKEIAILISLGTSHRKAFVLYLVQITFLGLISSLLASALSWTLIPSLGSVTKGLFPFPIGFSLSSSSLLVGILVGTLGCLTTSLPLLIQLWGLKPSILFTENPPPMSGMLFRRIIATLPGGLLFWGLSIWLSHSLKIGSLFTALFFTMGLLLSLSAWLLFKCLGACRLHQHLSLKWAIRDLTRNRFATVSAFLSIGTGMLLLNLSPQIQSSLQADLESPQQSKLPSLFLFDIQEEQRPRAEQIIRSEGLEFTQISPTVRARLKFINGGTFHKGDGGKASKGMNLEEEREMRLRNRGYNLSYRQNLSQSEKLVRGRPFSGTYKEGSSNLPEISVEKRFAKRLGLKVGDVLTFDVESVPIKGKIVNIRSVKWTAFQPNFFVQFQPGVLDLAPKTFIATLPHLSPTLKNKIQDMIVRELPNISIVDVSRVIFQIKEIMTQITWALQWMTSLCLIAGFIVIFSIANHQAKSRRWDIGLLKTLGANFRDIRRQFLWQYAIISFFASVFGIVMGIVVSFIISSFLFESLWAYEPLMPIISLIACVLMTLFITDLATRGALATKTRELLN